MIAPDPLAFLAEQLRNVEKDSRRDSLMVGFIVFDFMIKSGLVTRQQVADYVSSQAEELIEAENTWQLKGGLRTLALLFAKGAREKPQVALRVIEGGLNAPKPDQG